MMKFKGSLSFSNPFRVHNVKEDTHLPLWTHVTLFG